MSIEVADANRRAVAMLQNGSRDEALASFQRALVKIRQSVNNYNINPAERQGKGHGPIHDQHGETSNFINTVPPGCIESTEEWESAASPGNLFYLYNHAFDFERNPTMEIGSSQQESDITTMLSSVVLFNTALTYQRKGLFDGTNSSKKLRKALQLYSMASCLLSSQDDVADLYIVRLALLNNMGQLHSHLFEENDAIQCRVRLHKALFEGPARSLLSMASYEFFVRSTLCLGLSRDGLRLYSPAA